MRLSEHFTSEEFACKCGCGFDEVDPELIDRLEVIRKHFGKPVIINSGCRCEEYNRKIGGRAKSQHLFGTAADIVVRGIMPGDLYEFVDSTYKKGGLGSYKTFTHIDVRSWRARW